MNKAEPTIRQTLNRSDGHNIIAVASGKGGIGKTWLSVTLAALLAAQNKSVLLFDGDFGLANADVQLGIVPDFDLSGVLTAKIPLNKAITKYDKIPFDIIAGRSGSTALSGIPDGRLQLLRDDLLLLATHYDHVITDTGSDPQTAALFAKSAGTILIMTSDEPTALADAYAFITHFAEAGCENALRIIVNNATSFKEGERTYDTLIKTLTSFEHLTPPLAGIIRRDNRAREAVRAQIPLPLAYPDCEAVQDARALIRQLFPK